MIILAPEPKPALTPAPIKPLAVVNRFDRKLLEAIERNGEQPTPVWGVVHQIVADEGPAGRTERRLKIGRVLCRARTLVRRGIIVRVDAAHVRLAEPVKPPTPAPSPTLKPLKNLPPAATPSVPDSTTFQTGGSSRRAFKV